MKNPLGVSFTFLLLVSNAFAIDTKNCPSRLTIHAEGLAVSQTEKFVVDHSGLEDYEDDVRLVKSAYSTLKNTREVVRSFPLSRRGSGRCIYEANRRSQEKIEVYTKRGRDQLFLQAGLGNAKGILVRVYANLDRFTSNDVVVSEPNGMAMAIPRSIYKDYSAGGELVFVGNATDIRALIR